VVFLLAPIANLAFLVPVIQMTTWLRAPTAITALTLCPPRKCNCHLSGIWLVPSYPQVLRYLLGEQFPKKLVWKFGNETKDTVSNVAAVKN
jgi:hypothetical protein